MSKKRTFKELLQLLPQKEQPEDKAEKEAAEHAPQESEAENAAAAVQHESAYAKLGKAFINRLHLPNELIANAAEVESIVNRIMSAEQFRTLRKQLKRAAMDGRRIRL